jgi:hypothetical protein
MKPLTIKAYNGTGTTKTFAGEKTVDFPDNCEEAVKLWGLEKVMEHIKSSYVIEVQRQIRAGTTVSAKTQLNMLIAKAKTDPKIAELLKAADIKIPGEANGSQETQGQEAPTPPAAPQEAEKPAEKPTPRGKRR